jgi:uncharacterized protein YwgA
MQYAKEDERNGDESAFRYPAILGYLVKELLEKYPKVQIGKTKIQKLIFLLNREHIVDLDYSMHYYGPYSSQLSNELNFAESTQIIQSQWREDKGFFLKKGPNEKRFENLITEDEKNQINQIASEFGKFSAKELTIIATYHFLEDTQESINDLVEEIHKMKNYPEPYIEQVLKEARII